MYNVKRSDDVNKRLMAWKSLLDDQRLDSIPLLQHGGNFSDEFVEEESSSYVLTGHYEIGYVERLDNGGWKALCYRYSRSGFNRSPLKDESIVIGDRSRAVAWVRQTSLECGLMASMRDAWFSPLEQLALSDREETGFYPDVDCSDTE